MKLKDLLGCGNWATLMQHIVVAGSPDSFGHFGTYICEYDGISFFVKFAAYDNLEYDGRKPPPEGCQYPANAEINVMRAIKTRIIDRGYTPHFIEILAAYNCDLDTILASQSDSVQPEWVEEQAKFAETKIKAHQICDAKLQDEEQIDICPTSILCLIRERAVQHVARNHIALIFSELCSIPLPIFIAKHLPPLPNQQNEVLTEVIFQIYYTLTVATRVWPGFCHGDLGNLFNIMIKYDEIQSQSDPVDHPVLRYIIRNRSDSREYVFDVPFRGYFVKIIDFGHSKIPEEGIISAVEQNRPERANLFVEDHLEFIAGLQFAIMNDEQNRAKSLFQQNIFAPLNPLNIEHESRALRAAELARKSPTLESSLFGPVFESLRAKDKSHGNCIHTYRAPET